MKKWIVAGAFLLVMLLAGKWMVSQWLRPAARERAGPEPATAAGSAARSQVRPSPALVEAKKSEAPAPAPPGAGEDQQAGGSRIAGYIYDAETEEPIPDALVEAGGMEAQTDEEGIFVLEGVPPEVDRDVRVVLLRSGVIAGRVIDAESQEPLSAFTVKVDGAGVRVTWSNPGLSFSLQDGRFLIRGLRRETPMALTVIAGGYGPGKLVGVTALPEGRVEEQVVKLFAMRPIEGTVVDAESGAPLSGVDLLFARWDGRSLFWGQFDHFPEYRRISTGTDGTSTATRAPARTTTSERCQTACSPAAARNQDAPRTYILQQP